MIDEPDVKDPIGSKVRELRTARGMTQLELAQLARVTVMAVSRIELGRRLPSPPTIRALAGALGVEPGVLFMAPANVQREEDNRPGRPRKLPEPPKEKRPRGRPGKSPGTT